MKKKLPFLFLLCVFGMGSSLLYGQPTADLLNVQFHVDGGASDLSASAFNITNGPGATPAIIYDSVVKQYVARFPGISSTYFKVDYKDNTTFKNKLINAFTLEVYAQERGSGTQDPVSSQESGGFGFEQLSGGGATQFWFGYEGGTYKNVGSVSVYDAVNPVYHHIVCTYDGTTIKMYYDGVLKDQLDPGAGLRLAPNDAAHWIGIGGDAHTSDLAQSAYLGDIAVVRMYSTALTGSDVTALYNQIQDRASKAKFNELNTWFWKTLPTYIGLVTDAGKKGQAQQLVADGKQLMESATTTEQDITDYIADIHTQLSDLDAVLASDTLPRFVAISDTHIGSSNNWSVKVNRAIDKILALPQTPDAVFVAGDVTDWGTPQQLNDAKSTFARLESKIPVYYFLMGNHDWYDENAGTNFPAILDQPKNQYVKIKGYPFIMISMESSSYPNAYMQTSQDFLNASIADAESTCPGKPIFLFVHVGVNGTVYGTNPGDGGWGTGGLKAICDAHPQMIVFSGHSHFPIGDPRCIWQGTFTEINDGSVTYSEIEPGLSEGIHPPGNQDVTEGCFVSVTSNSDVEVKRWDFTRDEEIQSPWLIKAPFDGSNFTYANRTGGASPHFDAGAKPRISAVGQNSCTITYPQGTDDEVVHHYNIQVVDKDGHVLSTPSMSTEFSRFYLNSDMPDSLSWTVTGLQSGTKYAIQVTAVDSYNNLSAPIVSDQFTTSEYIPDPSVVAPVADLLDVHFKTVGDNDALGASDMSPLQFPVTKGSATPDNMYDPAIQQYVSHFTGNSSNFYRIDYHDSASFKTTLHNAFTLDVYVKSEDADKDMCPVSAQEGGGFGIEQNGATQFWFNAAGSYVQVGDQSIYSDPPQFYHITYTYDGDSLRSYYNGVPGGKVKAGDTLHFPDNLEAQWIAIGGDAHQSSGGVYTAQYTYKGDVAFARMYSKALSRDEIVRLQEQIEDRQALTKVDRLNAVLDSLEGLRAPQLTLMAVNTDPGYQQDVDSLLTVGWALMNNMTTTDPDIQAFLDGVNTTLPVTLDNFTATLTKAGAVVLHWNSNVESNVKNYMVQRSTDGVDWNNIATIAVKGSNQSYSYTDATPAKGANYYRVRESQLDNDRLNVSKVRVVNVSADELSGLKVYPNPTTGIVHLVSNAPVDVKSIAVYNAAGSRVSAKITAESNGATIDLSGAARGIYFIRVNGKVIKVSVL